MLFTNSCTAKKNAHLGQISGTRRHMSQLRAARSPPLVLELPAAGADHGKPAATSLVAALPGLTWPPGSSPLL